MKTKDATAYFDQAADTFLNTFNSCVSLQQDTAGKFFDLAKKWGGADDWAKQYQDLGEKTMPQVKKAAEDSLKFWEENSRKCMKLLGEGFAATQVPSPDEAQMKLKKLWEDSLASMRENTETMVKTSSEALQAYVDFMKKQTETAAGKATAGA